MGEARILVVEDEQAIADVLVYNLERAGFRVEHVDRGDAALATLRASTPDLVVLDLMLPGMDGLEIARAVRRDPRTRGLPVVMLTARAEEVDRIVGFELGADDYITKPFSPREVVLRVKALLRRVQEPQQGEPRLQVGSVLLDAEGHRAFADGEELPLTATEFRLLQALIERPGRVRTRAQLLSDVWDYADDVESRTVDTHVRRLRRKLGDHAEMVETVIGVGYRFRDPRA